MEHTLRKISLVREDIWKDLKISSNKNKRTLSGLQSLENKMPSGYVYKGVRDT